MTNVFIISAVVLLLNQGISTLLNSQIQILLLGLFSIYLSIVYIKKNGIHYYIRRENIILVLFLFLVFLLYSSVREPNLLMYLKGLICFFISYLIFLVLKSESKKCRKIVVGIFILDIIIVGIKSFIMLQNHPYIARDLASGWQNLQAMQLIYPDLENLYAIGGFGYFYALPIFLLSGIFFCKKNKLSLIFSVFGSLLLIQGQYLISMISYLTALAVLIYRELFSKKITKRVMIVVLLILALFVLLALLNLNNILQILEQSKWIPSVYIDRLREIQMFFSGKDIANTDLYLRLKVYFDSIQGIFNNRLLINFKYILIGEHSTVLDFMSMFGIFSILLFMFFAYSLKTVKNYMFLNHENNLFVSVIVYFIIIAILNPVLLPQISLALYVFMPFASVIIREDR